MRKAYLTESQLITKFEILSSAAPEEHTVKATFHKKPVKLYLLLKLSTILQQDFFFWTHWFQLIKEFFFKLFELQIQMTLLKYFVLSSRFHYQLSDIILSCNLTNLFLHYTCTVPELPIFLLWFSSSHTAYSSYHSSWHETHRKVLGLFYPSEHITVSPIK